MAHIFSSGAMPVVMGGDHSIGFPTVRGIAQRTSKRIGIIHFDRANVLHRFARHLPAPDADLHEIGRGHNWACWWHGTRASCACVRRDPFLDVGVRATPMCSSCATSKSWASIGPPRLRSSWHEKGRMLFICASMSIASIAVSFPAWADRSPAVFCRARPSGLSARSQRKGCAVPPPMIRPTSPRCWRCGSLSRSSGRSLRMGKWAHTNPSSTNRCISDGPRRSDHAPKGLRRWLPRGRSKRGFLLLANIPLERADVFEVGTVSPGFARRELGYQPLPDALIKPRAVLRFVYRSSEGGRSYTLAELLSDRDAAADLPHPHHGHDHDHDHDHGAPHYHAAGENMS
jgi:Arginase family